MSSISTLRIELDQAGKKFFRNWIFRNLSLPLEAGQKLAILGPNGSGKSTLLQVISGFESLSEGHLHYTRNGIAVPREEIFRHTVIAAPYLDLIEDYALSEIIRFHFQFKPLVSGMDLSEVLSLTGLYASRDKVFKYFSSGMKQRVKLALAILSDVDLILLDEPLSNLDRSGEQWYQELAEHYLVGKTVVVCSNQNAAEYFFCSGELIITDFQ